MQLKRKEFEIEICIHVQVIKSDISNGAHMSRNREFILLMVTMTLFSTSKLHKRLDYM